MVFKVLKRFNPMSMHKVNSEALVECLCFGCHITSLNT